MSSNAQARIIRFAGFEVDFAQCELRKHGVRIRLQHKPFQILELLLRRPGALVTREELARQLWPDSHVSFERCLNTAVNNLRHALGDASHGARFIETRPGLGYVFIARAEEIAAPQSYRHDYLKGRYLLDKMTEEDTHKATAYFQSASRLSDQPALDYAALAVAHCELARLSPASIADARLQARKYSSLALTLDANLADAHLAAARVNMLFDLDWNAAQSGFLRALELNPECAAAHRFYAGLLMLQKHSAAALQHISNAQSKEPLSLPIGVDAAWHLYLSQRYEAAAEQCWKLLTLEPRFWHAQMALGLAYARLGLPEEAETELQNAVICSQDHPLALAARHSQSVDVGSIFFGCIQPAPVR